MWEREHLLIPIASMKFLEWSIYNRALAFHVHRSGNGRRVWFMVRSAIVYSSYNIKAGEKVNMFFVQIYSWTSSALVARRPQYGKGKG